MQSNISQKLKTAIVEKDVEAIFKSEFSRLCPDSKITSEFKTDGLFEHGTIRTLLEFKFNAGLKQKISQCNVLIQALFYLKKMEENGNKLADTIFVGDQSNCFAIHSNAIVKYLSHEIDWKIAPSEAHRKNPELLQAMVGNQDIMPFVYEIDEKFELKEVLEQIQELSKNIVRKVRVTEKNIVTIFEYFKSNVLGDKCTLDTNSVANLFVQLIINPSENYLHPKKKNVLTTKSFGEITVNHNLFQSFFRHFEGDVYSPSERERLTGYVDRLVEDTTRRMHGEFFTPPIWCSEAHKYISEVFGGDWKEKYVVWDPAAGTLNLERDYRFKELYCSTLVQSDIDTANQMGYNKEAVKFQYDFLNYGVVDGKIDVEHDDKLPEGLKAAITGDKKIIILMNPPYGTANNMGTTEGDHKGGISKTIIGDLMKKDEYGAASQQLYAQFLYKIQKIKQQYGSEIHIAIFSPPLFLSGGSYAKFREKFFVNFEFQKGFLLEASNFSDVAKGWGISFAIFK